MHSRKLTVSILSVVGFLVVVITMALSRGNRRRAAATTHAEGAA